MSRLRAASLTRCRRCDNRRASLALVPTPTALSNALRFLWARKLYWIVPMALTLLLLALLVALTESSSVAPFIYTLF